MGNFVIKVVKNFAAFARNTQRHTKKHRKWKGANSHNVSHSVRIARINRSWKTVAVHRFGRGKKTPRRRKHFTTNADRHRAGVSLCVVGKASFPPEFELQIGVNFKASRRVDFCANYRFRLPSTFEDQFFCCFVSIGPIPSESGKALNCNTVVLLLLLGSWPQVLYHHRVGW